MHSSTVKTTSIVRLDRAAAPLKFQANRVSLQARLDFVFCAVTLSSALGRRCVDRFKRIKLKQARF
jgi:hypothetical protein